jgi:hypothetical protein
MPPPFDFIAGDLMSPDLGWTLMALAEKRQRTEG